MRQRIRTTHAGSLPRPVALAALHARRFAGETIDLAELAAQSRAATKAVVRQQCELGIDVVNNGEVGRESFFTYVQHRMSGFSGVSRRPPMRDLVKYPGYLGRLQRTAFATDSVSLTQPPQATGDVMYGDTAAIDAECREFTQVLKTVGREPADAFMSAPSPGIVVAAMENRHYPDLDAYLQAVSAALTVEYRAILRHGFILQIDAPDLAMERHTYFSDQPLDVFVGFVERVGAAINTALRGVPRSRIRLHVCWGNYEGPHHLDAPMESVLPVALKANAQALLFESSNPRHAHEWTVFREAKIPQDRILIPGVLDSTTNFIEHPQLVAERICRFADIVGRERVMAGTDCGFGTFADHGAVDADIVYAKLASLVEGAKIASARLW